MIVHLEANDLRDVPDGYQLLEIDAPEGISIIECDSQSLSKFWQDKDSALLRPKFNEGGEIHQFSA